jgi:8-oxo-dGTP pyrophosphatase MutT (NUDIX family)
MSRVWSRIGHSLYMVSLPALFILGRSIKPRVRIVVTNQNHEILLVKSWFGSQKWSLPGGGVKRGESSVATAVRELFEETGLLVLPTQLSDEVSLSKEKKDHFAVQLFFLQINNPPPLKQDSKEILACQWFSLDAIPQDCSPLIPRALGYML